MDYNLGGVDCECDDDGRPGKTRQRQNSISFPTLQSITGRKILANMETIPVQTLTCSLWQLLLEQLESVNSKFIKWDTKAWKLFEDESSYKKTFANFDRLVGPKCTKFCVDWLLVLCPFKNEEDKVSCLSEVLQVLAKKAVNLEELTIGRDPEYKILFYGVDDPDEMDPFLGFKESLLALKNLRSLTLNKFLLPQELILIGSHLQKLEMLKCDVLLCEKMSDLEQATIQMMGNLKNLHHFNYSGVWVEGMTDVIYRDLDRRQAFGIFCLKNFPQLQTIGPDGELPLLYGNGQLQLPSDPQLTQITVDVAREWFKSLTLDPFLMLTHITQLRVKMMHDPKLLTSLTTHQLSILLNFAELRELTLELIIQSDEVLRLFLKTYGKNLVKLRLVMLRCSNVQVLQVISELCPVLEDLNLVVGPNQAFPLLANPGSLASLKTLQLYFHKYRSTNSVEILLLAAPNLQKFALFKEWLSQTENQRLSSLLKSQQICSQLQSFTVHVSPAVQTRFKAMSELTKNMCAYCPKLVDSLFRVVALRSGSKAYIRYKLKKFKDCCLWKCLNTMDNVQFN